MIKLMIQMTVTEEITDIMTEHSQLDGKILDGSTVADQPIRIMVDEKQVVLQHVGFAKALRREVGLYISIRKGFLI